MGALGNIKISKFEYEEKVPSTGKRVTITPFRVGDEKVLLEASQSEDVKHMQRAMKQVINNCVEGADVSELASFDMDYLFIKIRSRSVGETSEIGIKCKECEAMNKITVNLDDLEVYKNSEHTRRVKIQDDLMFEMKYPDTYGIDITSENQADQIFEVIFHSLDKVYYGEEIIDVDVGDKEDVFTMLNQMNKDQFAKVQTFFETMPKLKKDVTFTCGSCNTENEYELEGLQSFLS